MREIILDTETTGFYTKENDRIVEIGCVEVFDKKITGKNFHCYVNPEREMSEGAMEISGLTYEFLKSHKTFDKVASGFLDFIGNDRLVIHNASFDVEFINYELSMLSIPNITNEVVDTLNMARSKFPGSPASLDALCRRFNVNSSSRQKHGALIDAKLLAEVYLSMSVSAMQRDIFSALRSGTGEEQVEFYMNSEIIPIRKFENHDDDNRAHTVFMSKIKNPLWENFNF